VSVHRIFRELIFGISEKPSRSKDLGGFLLGTSVEQYCSVTKLQEKESNMACKVYDNKKFTDETPAHPPLLFHQSVPRPFLLRFSQAEACSGTGCKGRVIN
jgi:hypothetical protein